MSDEAHERTRKVLALKQGVVAALSVDPDRSVQWAALADAVALYLAQYRSNHRTITTEDMRLKMLHEHIELVMRLIPPNEAMLDKAHAKKRH